MIDGGEGSTLPAVIKLNNPDTAYDVWVLWRATDRQFLPSQLIQEPIGLLHDMLELDGIYQALVDLTKADSNG